MPVQHVGADHFQLLDPDRKSAKKQTRIPAIGRIELPTEEKEQKEQKLPAISIAITAKTMPESEMPSKGFSKAPTGE